MKIVLATIRVPLVDLYKSVEKRWLDTYIEFKPGIDHELVVVDSDVAAPPGEHGEHANRFMVYTGGGWDCGTWQWLANEVEADLLVCCNTSTHYWKHGWMERFVEEVEKRGDGLYGSMASYEIAPHMRTPVYVFQPHIMRRYPGVCNSRAGTYTFECAGGRHTFTSWCRANGVPTWLVTWDGCYDLPDWRKPDNIFREGDQSNILVKDRHSDTYEASDEQGKATLSKMANGK